MTDERLRAAERAGKVGGIYEEARLLVERLRAGTFPRRRAELLAELGDPRARIALGLEVLPDDEADPEVIAFEERLAETIVWCSERSGSPREVFRSAETRPADVSHPADLLPAQCEQVAMRRRQLLDQSGWLSGARAVRPGGGALVLYAPDMNLADGGAEAYSEGFFDTNNVPPWDTWVGVVENQRQTGTWQGQSRYVVAWIAPEYLPFAEQGVWVNAEECIIQERLDSAGSRQRARPDDAFLTKLRARGLC